jgi:hypothetical protein
MYNTIFKFKLYIQSLSQLSSILSNFQRKTKRWRGEIIIDHNHQSHQTVSNKRMRWYCSVFFFVIINIFQNSDIIINIILIDWNS